MMEKDQSDEAGNDKMANQQSSDQLYSEPQKDMFKTPVQTYNHLLRDGDLIRSIDSGFSESTFSSPDLTPLSSGGHVVSGVVKPSSKSDDFKYGTFSPVSRLPNLGRARRTSRISLTSKPPVLRLGSKEDESDSDSSIKSVLPNQDTSLKKAVLLEVESSSSMSSSTDELEFSLQEMSLEELSSSSSPSPVFGIPLPSYQSKAETLPAPSCEDSSDSCNDLTDNENDQTLLDLDPHVALSSCGDPVSQESSTTTASTKPDKQVAVSNANSMFEETFPEIGQSLLYQNATQFDSRVPILPHQYNLIDQPGPSHDFENSQSTSRSPLDYFNPPPYRDVGYVPPACRDLLKSPSKRGCTSQNSDEEFAFLRSPTKLRKTFQASPVRSQTKKGRAPSKKRLSLEGQKNNVIRSIFSDHVSDLRSPLVNKTFDFRTAANTNNEDESMATIERIPIAPKDEKSPPRSPRKLASRSLFDSSPRKIGLRTPPPSPRKMTVSGKFSPQKSSGSSTDSPSKLAVQSTSLSPRKFSLIGSSETGKVVMSSYSSPRKVIATISSPFASPRRLFIRSPHLSPNKVNKSPQKSPRKLKLEKILREFSPKDPSRLIGRFTGAGKFDIVGELSCRGILHCLQYIFSFLHEKDICRICQVNGIWQSAVIGDPVSIQRRNTFLKLSRKHQACLGKENPQFKNSLLKKGLTSSRGHLTTLQAQAISPKKLNPPSPQKRAGLDLLASDKLRSCPDCNAPAKEIICQDRAICSACKFDFCLLCFSAFHGTRRCKPLCLATSARKNLAGSRKSKKNLRRL